jgi:FkbM family methyltransferase
MINVIRFAVELLSRGKVLKRHISVNGIKTPILITPDSQLKYLKLGKNPFDRDLINIAERFLSPDSNVWDIGANVGVFTIAAASVANKGSVLSVEPDIWLAGLIQRTANLTGNKKKDIRVLPAAISEYNSVATLIIAKRGRASNRLGGTSGKSQMGGIRNTQYVPTITIDNLLKFFPKPDFIKIDVEGAELLAIRGAAEVISSVRPIFYIEVRKRYSSEIKKFFRTEKYRLFDGESYVPIKNCTFNTFFVPEEKVQSDFISHIERLNTNWASF